MTYINPTADIEAARYKADNGEIERIRSLLLGKKVSFISDDHHTHTPREGIV